MKIYHGSKIIIEEPKQKGSNPENDYGPAFYVTTDLEMAKSWACRNNAIGVVNEYEIDSRSFANLKILDLTNKDQYSILNWLAILVHYRKFNKMFLRDYSNLIKWLDKYYIDIEKYDVVKGFRADDAYFKFPVSVLTNQLSIEDLQEVFMLGNLGIQYAFISKRAIKTLHFSKAVECDNSYLGHYFLVVKDATKTFNEILNKPLDPHKHFLMDLWRKDNE